MIITKTTSKYQVGCKRGMGIEIPNLVDKLNLIIDKERSQWPTQKDLDDKVQENLDLGLEHELKEGDVFVVDGTVLAVDHDKLVQVVSETGPLAYKRIYEEIIEPEIEFSYHDDEDNSYSWEELEDCPKNLKEYFPKYSWLMVWKNNFEKGRNLRPIHTIKTTITDDLFGITREVYITHDLKVFYDENQFSEEEMDFYFKNVMSYFYSEVGRCPMSDHEKGINQVGSESGVESNLIDAVNKNNINP